MSTEFEQLKKKGLFDWLKKEDADVMCLQEIKAQEDQLDERFYPKEYHCYYHPAQKKGYSGTAIFSKKKPNIVTKKKPTGKRWILKVALSKPILMIYPWSQFISILAVANKNDKI